MEKQTCRTCGIGKSVENYWKQKSKPSGRFAECKLCAKKRNREWHETNAEKVKIKTRVNSAAYRKNRTAWNLYRAAKDRAQRHGLDFSLKLDDIVIPSHCPVLGIELQSGSGRGMKVGIEDRDRRPSVDRIDNSKGYHADNIVVVSWRVNRLKSDGKIAELEKICSFYGGHLNG